MCRKNADYPLYLIPSVSDFHDLVRQKAVLYPDRTAFAWYDRNQRVSVSYGRFYRESLNTAEAFLSRGYTRQNIGILGTNSYKWLLLFSAVILSGNTAVPLDGSMLKDELQDVLDRMDVRMLLTDTVMSEKQYLEEKGIRVLPFDHFTREESESISCRQLPPEICKDDPACIFLTSGTTGRRKGVVLTHTNIAEDIYQSCRLFMLEGDSLAILPFYHAFGLIASVWMIFHYGHTVYISRGLRYIQRELSLARPQTMLMVPLFVETFYRQIIRKAEQEGKLESVGEMGHALFGGRLEYIICGGAALDRKYIQNYRKFGIEILNGYGTTECASVASVNRNFYYKDGTVGLPIPDSRVIISESGEVLISGRHVMKGYYRDPEETKKVLEDGWYHTGDLGTIDEEGFLTLTGRVKNLIILSSGENISPEELEEKLLRINRITEVIVSSEGQFLKAEIYAENIGRDDTEAIISEIQEMNRACPMYKRISKIVFRDKPFEKTSTQKIVRKSPLYDKRSDILSLNQ